jgi:hypothetical protein
VNQDDRARAFKALWVADAAIMAVGIIAYWKSNTVFGVLLGLACFLITGALLWLVKRRAQNDERL